MSLLKYFQIFFLPVQKGFILETACPKDRLGAAACWSSGQVAGLRGRRSGFGSRWGPGEKEIYFLAAYQCFGGHFKPSVQSAKSLGSLCFLYISN